MSAYLLAWNPNKYDWVDLQDNIEEAATNGETSMSWSCGQTKKIVPGDRVFLMKLGTYPKGIMASGYATSTPFPDRHFSEENRRANYIDVAFDVLLPPEKGSILDLEILQGLSQEKQSWTPENSGISIRDNVVGPLEKAWAAHLKKQRISKDLTTNTTLQEGASYEITLTQYERNPEARQRCIAEHGLSCSVCGFDFKKTYGPLGEGYIHVHHISQLADAQGSRTVDPVKDLIPVCPNCHAMLHRKREALSILQLKKMLKKLAK